MLTRDMINLITDRILNFDIEKSRELTRQALQQGISPNEIITQGLLPGLNEIGNDYERGVFFLSELLLAGEAAKAVLEETKPYFRNERHRTTARLLIGTVEGDLHDIGKNLVSVLAESSGFEVLDLGVDVTPKSFVEKIKTHKPDVVALSSLLSISVPKFKETIDQISDADLRERVKIILGGRSASEKVCREYGADGYAEDAVLGVRLMSRWFENKNRQID